MLGGDLGLFLGHLQHLPRGESDVVQHGQVGEEVERLEHDADAPTSVVGVELGVGDVNPVEQDLAVVDRLEEVDAAEQGGLPRPRRPHHGHDLVGGEGEADIGEDGQVAELLPDTANLEKSAHMEVPVVRSRWRRIR